MIIETCPRCGNDLINFEITTYPPIPGKECLKCGWRWTGEPEKIVRVPFMINNGKFDERSKNNNKEDIKLTYTGIDEKITEDEICNLFA